MEVEQIGIYMDQNFFKLLYYMSKEIEILKVSNLQIVRKLANKYLGKNVPIYLSTRKDKKYMVQNPEGKLIHFGSMKYEDYTFHELKSLGTDLELGIKNGQMPNFFYLHF